MPKFSYVAMDSRGKETKGTLDVANQNEAIGRLKEMGFFPTKVVETDKTKDKSGIPLLMDIPVLGHLFRSTSSTEARNELIVLIRPTVLQTPEIAALTAESEKRKLPGIRETEKEIRGEDEKRLRQLDKEEQKQDAKRHKRS